MLTYNTRLLYLKRYICNQLDPEMFKLASFLPRKELFLDIGANRGLYTYHFATVFKNVIAFEPVKTCNESISNLRLSNVETHQIALSDRTGTTDLIAPIDRGKVDFQRSSIVRDTSSISGVVKQQVQVNRLDAYNFTEVDLIKIDTEGSENLLLNGAITTIENNLPLVFIELEERHRKNAVKDGITFFKKFGYQCCYYDKRQKTFVDLDINNRCNDDLLSIASNINNYLFYIPLKHSVFE